METSFEKIADAMMQLAWLLRNDRMISSGEELVILLPSPDAGHRFLTLVRDSHQDQPYSYIHPSDSVPVMSPTGEAWKEIDIVGCKVRWPAKVVAYPDGGWEYF